ncbi:MAG: hypothetical protein AB8C95_01075, partial [Phycisphaeraceae bacterium]
FAEGFEKLSDEKLIELLGHEDQRVRIHAQWEIAKDNRGTTELIMLIADKDAPRLQKLHAVWAAGMKCRDWGVSGAEFAGQTLAAALLDDDQMIRAHAISTLGDLVEGDSTYKAVIGSSDIIESLGKAQLVLEYHSAIALGKIGSSKDVDILFDMLDRNDNNDVAIRHAASYGLSLIGDTGVIAREMKQRGAAARLGGVLALRRLDSPLLANFLNDEDPLVAAEAARAIYDKRIMDAMPPLAGLSGSLPVNRMSEPVMRRVIEANVRLADQASAMRLGQLAANSDAPEMWRLLALQELDGWAKERNRGGVWGAWWPRPEQTMEHAATAMLTYLPSITDGPSKVIEQSRTLMQRHVAKSTPTELAAMALNPEEPEALRLSTLQMLTEADKTLATTTAQQLADDIQNAANLRIKARLALLGLDLDAGQQSYAKAIASGELSEQQDAIQRLGRTVKASRAIPGEAFAKLADALKRKELDAALVLDVVQAVSTNKDMPTPVRLTVQQYVDQNQSADEVPFVREASLRGGSIARGKDIFLNQDVAQCQRCHAADGSDSVGPGLNGIAAQHDANYFYDALVRPGATIAKGFASTTVNLTDGTSVNGRILNDQSTDATLVLTNADGVITEIPRDQVAGQPIVSDVSLMPTMTDKLSPMELRDVIAYLGSLESNPSPAYRMVGASGSKASGPQVAKPAAGIKHAILLPIILIVIAASMVALLLATILGAQLGKP